MIIRAIERRCVYPAPPRDRGDWRPDWLRPQNVWFRSADGTKIHAWYVPRAGAKRHIVFCHGNTHHVADHANLIYRLQNNLQATVFAFDYRGYGKSRGKPFEGGCISDGMAAQQWLARRENIRPDQIIVMGRSLGGAIATAMAAEQGARALVLENTFSSLHDATDAICPWFPLRLFMRNRFDSATRIPRYAGPTFQSHGTADRLVPIRLGQKLFEQIATTEKVFYEIPNAGHFTPQPPDYFAALNQFLARIEGNDDSQAVSIAMPTSPQSHELAS